MYFKFIQNRKFSLVCRVVPERWYVVHTHGWVHSVCALESYTGPVALWGSCLFVLSKIALLGDSVFIVLRKQDLHAVHLWHHISTLVYTWYMTGERQVGTYIIDINSHN